MAILAGIVHKSRFIADELTVACELGITVDELRSFYEGLYFIDQKTNGIVVGKPSRSASTNDFRNWSARSKKSSRKRPKTNDKHLSKRQKKKSAPKSVLHFRAIKQT